MVKGLWLMGVLGLLMTTAHAQTDVSKLPVTVKAPVAGNQHPIVLFLSGDGGMKKFAVDMVNAMSAKGYPVLGVNSLKYFWSKKTPQQAGADMAALLEYYAKQWNNHSFLLVGYSMGADVLPFIYQHLGATLQGQTVSLVFMSPSASTDMVVHISDMLGKTSTPGALNVPAAMNTITNKPLLLIFGKDESDFDLKKLTVTDYKSLVLPGGHHYNDDANGVVTQMVTRWGPK